MHASLRCALALSLVTPAVAQDGTAPGTSFPQTPPGTYTVYGSGCPGTGSSAHAGVTAPKPYDTQMGTSNNYFPFGRANMHYQQVFDQADFGGTKVLLGIALRQSNTTAGRTGGTQTIKLTIGMTTKSPQTIAATFATNYDVTAPTVVFQGNINIPTLSGRNNNPNQFAMTIRFTRPYPYPAGPGKNLLIDVENTSTSNVLQFWDATATPKCTRIYGFASSATSGTVHRSYGVIMCFVTPSSGAVPKLSNTGRPVIGQSFSIDLSQARPSTAAALLSGLRKVAIDLTAAGAPGCTLLTTPDIIAPQPVSTAGTASIAIPLPNLRGLVGARFYSQWAVLDAVNAMKLVFSNGGDAFVGDS